jgi:hypothetical protein
MNRKLHQDISLFEQYAAILVMRLRDITNDEEAISESRLKKRQLDILAVRALLGNVAKDIAELLPEEKAV